MSYKISGEKILEIIKNFFDKIAYNMEIFIVKNWIVLYKINRIIIFNGGNLWKTKI